MRLILISLCSLLIPILLPEVCASQKLEDLPGYVDFGSIEGLNEEEASVEVFLRDSLLHLVAAAARKDEPELSAMLDELRLIQVRVFPFEGEEADAFKGRMDATATELESMGWEKVVRVRDDHEEVYVHLRMEDDEIVGLLVMAVEPGDEVVFVNIVGRIDPEQLGRLGSRFNISPLDSLSIGNADS